MFGLGTPEILLIVVGIALLFGGKKIPEMMKGLGTGIKEFKTASSAEDNQEDQESNPKAAKPKVDNPKVENTK